MLHRKITQTADGSSSIFIPEWNEYYHSHHGALQESQHVFIEKGFHKKSEKELTILELGFGTGLNYILTFLEAEKTSQNIHYIAFEKFPISIDEFRALHFEKFLTENQKDFLQQIHELTWNEKHIINENFYLTKYQKDFFEIQNTIHNQSIDLVYFDCFGARVQPEFWEEKLLSMVVNTMKKNGLLTTYSSKGSFRRSLQNLGLKIEKIAGPKGKREMINAWKQ